MLTGKLPRKHRCTALFPPPRSGLLTKNITCTLQPPSGEEWEGSRITLTIIRLRVSCFLSLLSYLIGKCWKMRWRKGGRRNSLGCRKRRPHSNMNPTKMLCGFRVMKLHLSKHIPLKAHQILCLIRSYRVVFLKLNYIHQTDIISKKSHKNER